MGRVGRIALGAIKQMHAAFGKKKETCAHAKISATRAPSGSSTALSKLIAYSLMILLALNSALPSQSHAQTAGDQIFNGYYNVGVFISSDNDGCFIPGGVRAIRQFTTERAAEINQAGGINRRELRLKFMDELDKVENTKRLVNEAVKDNDMIAMIGLNSSTRGAQVVDKIGRSGIPLISEMSRNDLYAPFDNIYALTSAVEDELAVVKKFIEDGTFSKAAFVGQKGNLYVERISEQLSNSTTGKAIEQNHWLKIASDYTIKNEAEADRIIDQLVTEQADFLFLAIHSGPGAQFLKRLQARNVTIPIFIVLGNLGRIQQIMKETPYPADMYKRVRGNAPFVLNERLRQRIWKSKNQNWIFQPEPSPKAPAACADKKAPKPIKFISDPRNHNAINYGVRYRDMLSLIAETATNEDGKKDPATIRNKIKKELSALKQGEKVYRGWWHNWSFTHHRAVAENSFVVHLHPKIGEMALSPSQYQLTPTGLRKVPVVYISIDMVRILDINSNEQSFQSEFYLSFRNDTGIDIKDIEFTNAYRAQFSKETLINIRQIHSKDGTGPLPPNLKLYKITGKFMFNPDLRRYPFDKQRFSISFQPSNAASPFIIQPPPNSVAQSAFESDGWNPELKYVGSDQDIISVIGDHVSQQKIIPLYKFNFTWTMKRIATDYYLRVLVPLIVILMTTYLSVFIPAKRLESVVAIQVTALLSSIALYLSIEKLNFEHATISDWIFVITYLAITVMLAFSVMRDQCVTKEYWKANSALKYFQVGLIPLAIMLMVGIVFYEESIYKPLQHIFAQAGL